MARPDPWQTVLSRRALCGGALLLAGGAFADKIGVNLPAARYTSPQIAGAGSAPFAFLSAASTPQGTAFSVHVRDLGGSSGTAIFNGRPIALQPLNGYLVALFGAGQPAGDEGEMPAGVYIVQVALTTANGSSSSFTLPITVSTTPFSEDAVDIPAGLLWLLTPDVQRQEARQLMQIYRPLTPAKLWSGLFMQPAQGPITTEFGEARSYNGGPISGHHSGMDIAVPAGAPIHASAAGRVAWTGTLAERGNFTAIDHGLGVYSGYAHQSEIDVRLGQIVRKGDIIGRAGSTGLSTGPHVHWECAVNGMNVDPLRWTCVLMP